MPGGKPNSRSVSSFLDVGGHDQQDVRGQGHQGIVKHPQRGPEPGAFQAPGEPVEVCLRRDQQRRWVRGLRARLPGSRGSDRPNRLCATRRSDLLSRATCKVQRARDPLYPRHQAEMLHPAPERQHRLPQRTHPTVCELPESGRRQQGRDDRNVALEWPVGLKNPLEGLERQPCARGEPCVVTAVMVGELEGDSSSDRPLQDCLRGIIAPQRLEKRVGHRTSLAPMQLLRDLPQHPGSHVRGESLRRRANRRVALCPELEPRVQRLRRRAGRVSRLQVSERA